MVLTFNIKIDDKGFKRLINNLGKKAIPNLHEANKNYLEELKKSIRKEFINKTNIAPRDAMASRMNVRELNKREVGLFMPLQMIWQDSMKPHYVSLKRGRNITKWANKYYGMMIRSGKSRVHYTKKYGIKPSSFLYVMPDPYIDKAESRVRRRLKVLLSQAMQKTIREGRV